MRPGTQAAGGNRATHTRGEERRGPADGCLHRCTSAAPPIPTSTRNRQPKPSRRLALESWPRPAGCHGRTAGSHAATSPIVERIGSAKGWMVKRHATPGHASPVRRRSTSTAHRPGRIGPGQAWPDGGGGGAKHGAARSWGSGPSGPWTVLGRSLGPPRAPPRHLSHSIESLGSPTAWLRSSLQGEAKALLEKTRQSLFLFTTIVQMCAYQEVRLSETSVNLS